MKKIVKTIFTATLTVVSLVASAQTKNSLLWEISGKGLEKPSYVFGTIHIICQDDYLMTETIENTLQNADAYYAEINLGDPEGMMTMQKAMFSNVSLSKRLNANQYQEMKRLLKDVLDIDIAQFENLSNTAIISMITVKSFPCTDFKMYEMELLQTALKQQKKLGGLETIEQQIEIMSNSLNEDNIIQMLKELANDGFSSTKEMVEFYKAQNIEGLYELMKKNSYMTDSVYNEILTKRNHNWMQEMPQLMKNQSVFFAVGAGHLSGSNGVLELLKKEGYTIKPIQIQ
ncbi:TraB/GumN family protein [Paenimyroides aestuarii]|uniref:TraB/GumN family protein n=1 Tax=Paenimyroides aestuarii TaxID=2968490 RepID=A0ABY5NSH5_9FLAO|nr:TraB/GumN family protein [Paenimyroides aestuarii]UUV21535.1 TraB/GumN family protein [Paenimyroides aestuarii]